MLKPAPTQSEGNHRFRRHRLQFTIRSLLFAVTIVAALLGGYLYWTVPFRGDQHASNQFIDCRSTRYSVRLTNNTNVNLGYFVHPPRVCVDWMPNNQCPGAGIKPGSSIILSAEEVFGQYGRRGDGVMIYTWPIEPSREPTWPGMAELLFVP